MLLQLLWLLFVRFEQYFDRTWQHQVKCLGVVYKQMNIPCTFFTILTHWSNCMCIVVGTLTVFYLSFWFSILQIKARFYSPSVHHASYQNSISFNLFDTFHLLASFKMLLLLLWYGYFLQLVTWQKSWSTVWRTKITLFVCFFFLFTIHPFQILLTL